jgi:glutamine amidotransferase
MASIAIIDYGMGNLHSIAKAVEHVAGDDRVWVSADPDTLRRADRVIFPGVGAIRDCMAELHRLGLDELLREVPGTSRCWGCVSACRPCWITVRKTMGWIPWG